ncbi:MAG: phosphoenolpyruvate carboxykinase (ATP), partial [Chloroflexi bacterium]|nr:phosphoenolpyruvate carboxykinase (ATP) [Chloroflexota bacterium]
DRVTGKVDFFDSTLTSNGRAMVKRRDIAFTDNYIDLERVDYIIFITRHNEIVPPVVKLSQEWGSASFMLGESVETSAGDPSEAGKQRRVVGTNPFIVGSEEEEGNLFLSILRKNPHMQCYLLNTGKVGGLTGGQKVTVFDSVKILEMIARDKITWKKDDYWGYEVPVEIPGLDMGRFDLNNYYPKEKVTALSKTLKRERLAWLSQFEGLDPAIIGALKP